MEEESTSPAPKRSYLPLSRRTVTIAIVVAVLAVVTYLASLYNNQKYFLIVETGHVRVARGSFLPFGSEAYIPRDPRLIKAYRSVLLPTGMELPDGSSTFMDRVQLDQALYRLIKDLVEYSLQKDDERTQELVTKYLDQIDALPGLNPQQQLSVLQLRRDAGYVEARALLSKARSLLVAAEDKFRTSAKGDGSRYTDGLKQAALIRRMLQHLEGSRSEIPDAPASLEPNVPHSDQVPQPALVSPSKQGSPVGSATTSTAGVQAGGTVELTP